MTRIDHAPTADRLLHRAVVLALLLALAIILGAAALRAGAARSDPAAVVPDVAAAAEPATLSPQEALEVYDVYLDVARYAAVHDLRGLSPVSLERVHGLPPLP